MTVDDPTRRRLVVVGSGLSGSLLVQALAQLRVHADVVLVDPVEHPCRGRSWADWADMADAEHAAARCRRVRVVGRAVDRTGSAAGLAYATWDGDDVDSATDDALLQLRGRRLAATATAVTSVGGGLLVHTDGGELDADLVLDSVGLRPVHVPTPLAWLHAGGVRVVADRPCFDPDTVTLMDFRVAMSGGVRFGYVLPQSAREALVELTALSHRPEPRDLGDDLNELVVRTVAGAGWRVVGEESASIPLTRAGSARRTGADPRHVLIGSAAGLVKASTGYGYHFMARDAQVLAAEIASGRAPYGLRRRRRHEWMDDVFLRLGAEDPAALVGALERLFERNPLERVIRFLQEESTPLDEARLVASLPPAPFLRAALRLGD